METERAKSWDELCGRLEGNRLVAARRNLERARMACGITGALQLVMALWMWWLKSQGLQPFAVAAAAALMWFGGIVLLAHAWGCRREVAAVEREAETHG